jgi:hypothetical protein
MQISLTNGPRRVTVQKEDLNQRSRNMSTDRLGELRESLLHFVLAMVPPRVANRELCARERFDAALINARIVHANKPDEDKDVHLAGLMHLFDEIGIPHLASLPLIEEFVLSTESCNKKSPD